MGGMGVTRLLAALGGALVVAGIYLAVGLPLALMAAGVVVIAFAVLLVEVPERPEPASTVRPMTTSRIPDPPPAGR